MRAKILDRPRAKELAAVKFEQLPLERIRADLDAADASDEDLVYRYLMRKEDIARMHAATTGPVKEYRTDADPLVSLVAELSKLKGANSIHISKPGFNLTLGRTA